MSLQVNETPSPTAHEAAINRAKVAARGVSVFYGDSQALHSVDLDIGENEVTALIGPSGCGKSTFLRCLNRMNDTIPGIRVAGQVLLDGQDIYAPGTDVVGLRRRVGMVECVLLLVGPADLDDARCRGRAVAVGPVGALPPAQA